MNSTLKSAIKLIEQGKTILYPTDTVWGLGGNAYLSRVAERICTIKERAPEKGFIVLMKDMDAVREAVLKVPAEVEQLLTESDRPTTIIYELKDTKLAHLATEERTIAIRVPANGFVKDLLKELDFPLISTSANKSGDQAPARFEEIEDAIFDAVDMTLGAQFDSNIAEEPSRILKVEEDGSFSVIRA